MAHSSGNSIADIYKGVISDVISQVKEAFLDEGVDIDVLHQLKKTAQDVALLVSETINCQVGVGRLSFWFWKTANLPSLEVCVRIPPGRNSGLSCYSAITGIHSQEWVLHITELPPIEQPFEIVFKASFSANFDIIGLDEISYDATICGE
uniref:MAM domain-containing protein n=1 Tax=Plectus sambesii TaxID=2011161 RepID=A0A914XGN1_9BILA